MKEYRILSTQYDKEYEILSKEWLRLATAHAKLNGEIELIFKKVVVTKEISAEDLAWYLRIRTENDILNSEFKIISTKTNAIWIARQLLDSKMLKQYSPNVLFSAIDYENGRLKYWLEFKDELNDSST